MRRTRKLTGGSYKSLGERRTLIQCIEMRVGSRKSEVVHLLAVWPSHFRPPTPDLGLRYSGCGSIVVNWISRSGFSYPASRAYGFPSLGKSVKRMVLNSPQYGPGKSGIAGAFSA